MKKTFLLGLSALLMVLGTLSVNANSTAILGSPAGSCLFSRFHGGTEASVMVLEVKGIKSDKKADAFKSEVMKIQGVQSEEVGTKGVVTIQYNKESLGCCNAFMSSLKDKGYSSKLVSNKACAAGGNGKCQNSGKQCPSKMKSKEKSS